MIDNDLRVLIYLTVRMSLHLQFKKLVKRCRRRLGMHHNVPLVPAGLLMFAAKIIGPLGGKKVGIHPDRVKEINGFYEYLWKKTGSFWF